MSLPRKIELQMRGVIRRVHERRVGESLQEVEDAIRQWRGGKMSAFDVDEAIHQHQMRTKRFWLLYANTAVTSPEAPYIMEEALNLGIIGKNEYREYTSLRPPQRADEAAPRPQRSGPAPKFGRRP